MNKVFRFIAVMLHLCWKLYGNIWYKWIKCSDFNAGSQRMQLCWKFYKNNVHKYIVCCTLYMAGYHVQRTMCSVCNYVEKFRKIIYQITCMLYIVFWKLSQSKVNQGKEGKGRGEGSTMSSEPCATCAIMLKNSKK